MNWRGPKLDTKYKRKIAKQTYKHHQNLRGATYTKVGKSRWTKIVGHKDAEVLGRNEGGFTIGLKGRMYMFSTDDDQAYEVHQEGCVDCGIDVLSEMYSLLGGSGGGWAKTAKLL